VLEAEVAVRLRAADLVAWDSAVVAGGVLDHYVKVLSACLVHSSDYQDLLADRSSLVDLLGWACRSQLDKPHLPLPVAGPPSC